MAIGWVATRDYALCPTATMAEITTLHARLDLGGVTGASRPAIDQPWTAAGGYGRIRVGIGWVATRDYALCSTHPMTEIATLHAPLDLGASLVLLSLRSTDPGQLRVGTDGIGWLSGG